MLETAQDGVVRLLAEARWDAPTPCEGWDVATLARHLVTGERAFTTALRGSAYDLAAIDAEVQRIAPADLPSAYAEAAHGLRAAADAAPPERSVPLPLGPRPPSVAVEVRTLEAVVHGWDLARALGRSPHLGDDAALSPLVESADRLRAGLEAARPGTTALGTSHEVTPGAPALDRVVARFGRDPAWTPPPA
ncbi:TIGR03086 family metal-binding protein [Nocardioides marinquilinus]|uniref:TIGR03086 family metal-binding protein n=1 Tax=Nocardioides marinquilinus TaxID=1210400 RepID=A0ABP9P942_9ACTN